VAMELTKNYLKLQLSRPRWLWSIFHIVYGAGVSLELATGNRRTC